MIQATAISKWGIKPEDAPAGDYRFTEVAAETKEAAIERAERVCTRLGQGFAVVWDEGGNERRAKVLETGQEMSWLEFLREHGVTIGLLRKDEQV